jgi:hypothetical protein
MKRFIALSIVSLLIIGSVLGISKGVPTDTSGYTRGIPAVMANDTLVVKTGPDPVFDGKVQGEWTDEYKLLTFGSLVWQGYTTTVWAKHHNQYLWIGIHIVDPNVDPNDYFYMAVDVPHDHSIYPMTDDILICDQHALSVAYPIEAHGTGAGGIGWDGGAAPTQWADARYKVSGYYEFEFKIKYSLFGLTSGIPKTMGLEFTIVEPGVPKKEEVYHWPAGTVDNGDQSMWGHITSETDWQDTTIPEYTTAFIPIAGALMLLVALPMTTRKRYI